MNYNKILIVMALSATFILNLKFCYGEENFELRVLDQYQTRNAADNENIEKIDPISGDLNLTYRDLYLKGNAGLDINILRRYKQFSASEHPYHTPYGVGWRFDFGRLLINPTAGRSNGNSSSGYTFEDQNGGSHHLVNKIVRNSPYAVVDFISKDNWKMEACIDYSNELSYLENTIGANCGFKIIDPTGTVYHAGVRVQYLRNSPDQVTMYYVHRIVDKYGNNIKIRWVDDDDLGSSGSGSLGLVCSDCDTGGVIYGASGSSSSGSAGGTSTVLSPPTRIDTVGFNNSENFRFRYREISVAVIGGGTGKRVVLDSINGSRQASSYSYSDLGFWDGYAGNLTKLFRVNTNAGKNYTYSYFPQKNSSGSSTSGGSSSGGSLGQICFDCDVSNVIFGSSGGSTSSTSSNSNPRYDMQMRWRKEPSGLRVDYDWGYFDFVLNGNNFNKVGVTEKRVSGNIQSSAVWSYEHATRTHNRFGRISKSIVYTPTKKIEYFYYNNDQSNGNLWRRGLLQKRVIKKLSGSTLETTEHSYSRQNFINRRFLSSIPRPARDTYSYRPLKTTTRITRGNDTFTTTHSNFNQYGMPGRIIETGNDGSRTTTYTYHHNRSLWVLNQIATESISSIGTSSWSYNNKADAFKINKFGAIEYVYRDFRGNISSKRNANGRTTNYSNYRYGIAQSTRYPESKSTTLSVTYPGLITQKIDGEGNQVRFNYSRTRLSSISEPLGSNFNVSYNYCALGGSTNCSGIRLTRGSYQKQIRLDGYLRTTSITENGRSQTIRYDTEGRKTFESYLGTPSTGRSFSYDALDRIIRISKPGGSKNFSYLSNNRVRINDERGNVTYRNYRSYGNPNEKHLIRHSDSAGTTVIRKNKLGLLTSVTQGGIVRNYGYNSKYQLTTITDPETGVTVFGRDNVGNMVSKKVGNSPVTYYTYDGLNRLKEINYPVGTANVTLSYNKNDQITSVKNGVTRSFIYDANKQLTSELMSLDGLSWRTSYQYDNKGSLSSRTYPSGETVNYNPDGLGRATKAGDYMSSVVYHPNGEPKSGNYSNGKNFNSTLTARQELETLYTPGLMNLEYNYDAVGNVINITDAVDGNYNQSLGYDGINRLISASGKWGSGSVSYNSNSDILRKIMGDDVKNYSYSNGKLNVLNGGGFAYDYYGNIHTNHRGDTYNFNDASQLTEANGVKYTYDGGGSLVKKQAGQFTTYYFYDYKKSVKLGEYDVDGSPLEESFYLNDRMVAAKRHKKKSWVPIGVELPVFIQIRSAFTTPEKTYYHWNGLGSTMAATDTSGNLLWKEDYQPFGKQIRGEEDGRTSVFYNSKHFDKDSGLIYLAARWYDPDMGRFISTDPLRFREGNFQSFNRYTYANNNPYGYTDSTGNEAEIVHSSVENTQQIGEAGNTVKIVLGVFGIESKILDSFVNAGKVFKNGNSLAKGCISGECQSTLEGLVGDAITSKIKAALPHRKILLLGEEFVKQATQLSTTIETIKENALPFNETKLGETLKKEKDYRSNRARAERLSKTYLPEGCRSCSKK